MPVLDRAYRLHQLFSSRKTPISGPELDRRLDCSKATRERTIGFMRDRLDAPIEYNRAAPGYHYQQNPNDPPYELPGLWFSADELIALSFCHSLLTELTPGILQKQIDALRQRLKKILADHPAGAHIDPGKLKITHQASRRFDQSLFIPLAESLFDGKRLHIRYHARSNDRQTEREISPQRLTSYHGNWYLDAWCHLRGELRSFAVERIQIIDRLDSPAKTLAYEQLEDHFASAYGIFAGPAKHTAILEFSAERARWVADERWHGQQQGQWLEDGRYRLELPFNDPRELLMDILKHGAQVQVIGPPFLIEMVRREISEMTARYR